MSGLQSDAASSRRYDVAPRCSASGKITRHGSPLGGAASTRASTATARSSVRSPARLGRLAEVQSTSRALALRAGDDVVLQSRSGKDLGRYFPEVLEALRDELAPRCVVDGEVVVPRETPAHFIGFDAVASCTFAQLDVPLDYDLSDVLES